MDTLWSISNSVGKHTESVRSCPFQSSNNITQSHIIVYSEVPDIPASSLDKKLEASNESIAQCG